MCRSRRRRCQAWRATWSINERAASAMRAIGQREFAGLGQRREMPAQRALVARVVMLAHQLGEHAGPVARARSGLPGLHAGAAAQFGQAVQRAAEDLGVGAEVAVVLQQQLHAGGLGHGDPRAGAERATHGAQQGLRHGDAADLAALAFDEHRARVVQPAQRAPQRAVKGLLAGLRRVGQGAQHRAAVGGQGFEVQHLGAFGLQRLQQPRLATAGAAAQHLPGKACGQGGEVVAHLGPVGLVAALQLARAEADLAQEPMHGARALAAPPAIDQRPPGLGQVGGLGLDMAGDVARNERRAQLAGLERRGRVQQAHVVAFAVVQHRPVQCAGHVVLGELGR
jgi:hypothetical protein